MRTPMTIAALLFALLVGLVLGEQLGAANSHVRLDAPVGLGWEDLGNSLTLD